MFLLDIDTSKIQVGQVIKNYKELCKLLGQRVTTGGSTRNAQLKEFARYFKWEREGQKYIIIHIYNEPLPKLDKRLKGNNLNCLRAGIDGTYDIPYELSHKTGVYKIQKNNMVYIGSTKVGFRARYTQHCRNYPGMEHTKKLLESGGIYSIIWIAKDNDTEQTIRKKEQYYLDLYRSKGYIIVNKEDVRIKEQVKIKTKNIKLKEEDYSKAIQILNDQGIRIIA